MNWKVIFALILLILLVVFTTQNHEMVGITFLIWTFQTSRAIIVFSALVIGFLVGWISALSAKKLR